MRYQILIFLALCCPLFMQGQDLEIAGKAKIGVMLEDNSADSVVVRMVDGTLALRAVSSISPHQVLSISNDTIYLTDGGIVKLPAGFDGAFTSLSVIPVGLSDGDDDTQLTEAQVDAFANNNGYLSSEIDGSITNEIQALSISNDTIFLADGGFVKLPSDNNTGWTMVNDTTFTLKKAGIGTSSPVARLDIIGSFSDPLIPGSTSNGVLRIGALPYDALDIGKIGAGTYDAWLQAGFDGVPDPISLQPLGGNVGIGLTSPSEKLDVNGNVKVAGIISGVSDPVDAQDAATKAYVDSKVPTSGITPGTTAGEMLYWNGTDWVTVAAGTEGQGLNFCSGVPTWGPCPFSGSFIPVTNPATGKTWMDRNLGATQAATSPIDSDSYGDLYQWGRVSDGHQTIVWISSVASDGAEQAMETGTLSFLDVPGHGDFIVSPNDPWDWRIPQNDFLWQGVNGINNPCPIDYRIPTEVEWEAERISWSSNDAAGAFSPLKLPLAGFRANTGPLGDVGSHGNYWSSTVSGINSLRLQFDSSFAGMSTMRRARGLSVRCIKD